jgi:hypothetical protein
MGLLLVALRIKDGLGIGGKKPPSLRRAALDQALENLSAVEGKADRITSASD